MTVKEFIDKFSHNNETFLENKDNYWMEIEYPVSGLKECCMDWLVQYTDIADCEMICIRQVFRDTEEKYHRETITFKIDTDLKKAVVIPDKCTEAPLWLQEECGFVVNGGECAAV